MKQNIQTLKETKVESPTKKSILKLRENLGVDLGELMEMGLSLSNSRYDGDGTEWIYEVEDNTIQEVGSGSSI